MSILRITACQLGLSSFIDRKRNFVQFWLLYHDKMFFYNLSKIPTIPLHLLEGGDKTFYFYQICIRNKTPDFVMGLPIVTNIFMEHFEEVAVSPPVISSNFGLFHLWFT